MKVIVFLVLGIFFLAISIPFYPFIYDYGSNDLNMIPLGLAVTLMTVGVSFLIFSYTRYNLDKNPNIEEESKSNWARINKYYKERKNDLSSYIDRYSVLYGEKTYPYLRRKYPWFVTFVTLAVVIFVLIGYIIFKKGLTSDFDYVTIPFLIILPFIMIGVIGVSINYGKFYERIYIFEDADSFIITYNHVRLSGKDVKEIFVYDDWKVIEFKMKEGDDQGFPYYVKTEMERMLLIIQMNGAQISRKRDNDMSVHRKYGHPM